MRITELLLEDYPGIRLSVISNINRLYTLVKEVTNKTKYELRDPNSNYKPRQEFARWTNSNYLAGRKMGLDGQSELMRYMLATAKQKGAEVDYEKVNLVAIPGRGDSTSEVFQKMINFYTEYASVLAPYVPEFDEETVNDIKHKASGLKDAYQQFEAVMQSSGTKASDDIPKKFKQDDDYVDTTGNQNLGQQMAQADQMVYGIIDDIGKKHGKDVAHRIRQAVSKSGNKLVALKAELDKHGIDMNESVERCVRNSLSESFGISEALSIPSSHLPKAVVSHINRFIESGSPDFAKLNELLNLIGLEAVQQGSRVVINKSEEQ